MLIRVTAAAVLILLLDTTGCSSGNAGLYALPVRLIELGELAEPAAPLYPGEPVMFSVTWTDGRAPFNVAWSFGDGADPPLISAIESVREHSVWITPLNEGTGPVTYEGSVVITDEHLNEVRDDFTYTVQPAS